MVAEPTVYRKPPRANLLLVQAVTCFTLNPGESKWDLEDLISEQISDSTILANVIKHIAEPHPGPGVPCPVD